MKNGKLKKKIMLGTHDLPSAKSLNGQRSSVSADCKASLEVFLISEKLRDDQGKLSLNS